MMYYIGIQLCKGQRMSLIFKKELEIAEKAQGMVNKDIPVEALKDEYLYLSQKYEKLLKDTMKITRIGDMNLKKLMDAKDQVRVQKNELESLNGELREANAVKDKFYSIIAHDLRNPLQYLLLASGLLETDYETLTTKSKKKYISKISKTAKNLSELLENLLQWSRSQYGRLEEHPRKIDLYAIARENIEYLTADADKKNIRLILEIPKLSFVYADENMIKAVFRNLIGNAIKFTREEGSVTLLCEENKDFIVTLVKDTGVGIPEDKLAGLFELGTHRSTTGTAKEEGSGIGLMLCKEFVEKNRGEIRVHSKPDEGSVFTFSLLRYVDTLLD